MLLNVLFLCMLLDQVSNNWQLFKIYLIKRVTAAHIQRSLISILDAARSGPMGPLPIFQSPRHWSIHEASCHSCPALFVHIAEFCSAPNSSELLSILDYFRDISTFDLAPKLKCASDSNNEVFLPFPLKMI